jgi:ATP-dependent RNA/DNA helicase IGHMBP2
VELIQQAVHVHGWKVLVTAPSNVAVDNVLAKLVVPPSSSSANKSHNTTTKRKPKANNSTARLRVVRLGHPARLQESILPYSLEALVQAADGTEIVADVRAELQSHLRLLSKPRGEHNKRLVYREIKALRKEVRVREEKVVGQLMDGAQVVLATCVGAANQKLLRDQTFDLVVIDEAAQALEAACWIPALQARTKLVLAGGTRVLVVAVGYCEGLFCDATTLLTFPTDSSFASLDHLQLPPTIMSNLPAVQQGLGRTMFERVVELYGDESGKAGRVSRMLKVQYRMHESIANWASQALYGGELQTHESVKARTLAQLVGMGQEAAGLEAMPLLLLDTAGCNMYESENAAGSRFNEGEAQLVVQHVRKLIEMGVQQDQIAVITPYNGQVEVLRLALLPEAPRFEASMVFKVVNAKLLYSAWFGAVIAGA